MRRLVLLIVCARGAAWAQPASEPVEPSPADAPPPADPAPAPAPPPPVVVAPQVPASPTAVAATPSAPAAPAASPWFRLGGYIQPQFRLRQDSPAQFDQNGFRFARARLIAEGGTDVGGLHMAAFVEAELQPTFDMVDAFVTASGALPGGGKLSLDLGQTRVPISRQQLLSDSRLMFVDKAQLATIAPKRDLGARITFVPPHLPQLRMLAGAFNGEGPGNVENINQKLLYAGRLEVTPWGREAQLAESAFGGEFVTLGLSVGHNTLTPGDRREQDLYLGVDVSGAWRGLSGSFEYLEVRHAIDTDAMVVGDYTSNGFVAQLAYLLPFELPPARHARLEVGARLEEIDRNDTVPIAQPGDPEQSVRATTAVVSYYLRKHALKVQLAATRFDEIEDLTASGQGATYDNDQVLLQVTYRLE